MIQIKAIETLYNGYKFRSRLEARWAVFFDALGIAYEYEAQGYNLDGVRYLPDFWLPTFGGGLHCEVKPMGGRFDKAWLFCRTTGHSIWLCEGTPNFAGWWVLHFIPPEVVAFLGVPLWNQAHGENRMFTQPCWLGCDEPECGCGVLGCKRTLTRIAMPAREIEWTLPSYTHAVHASRQARFEHGETPCRETLIQSATSKSRSVYS